MIETDEYRGLKDFGPAWILANAIGLALAWPIAEFVGTVLEPRFGGQAALGAAMLSYEIIVWSMRSVVIMRLPDGNLIQLLDRFVLLLMEVFGWIIGDFLYRSTSTPPGSLIRFTSGSYLAAVYGGFLWAIFWLIRVQSRRPKIKLPAAKAILGSAGRIIASLLVFASFVLSGPIGVHLGYWVARTVGLYYGMAATGLSLGVTWVRSRRWPWAVLLTGPRCVKAAGLLIRSNRSSSSWTLCR